MRDYEPLPLEATYPLLDAIKDALDDARLSLDAAECCAKDDPDTMYVELGNAMDAIVRAAANARKVP